MMPLKVNYIFWIHNFVGIGYQYWLKQKNWMVRGGNKNIHVKYEYSEKKKII